MLKSAMLLTVGVTLGAATLLHAQSSGPVYTVYEANITDEAGYTAALPDVEKWIKENHGMRVAGGFNKTKLISGEPKIGNRYVVIKWDSEADFDKAMSAGLKAWIEKHGNGARQLVVQENLMK